MEEVNVGRIDAKYEYAGKFIWKIRPLISSSLLKQRNEELVERVEKCST